MKVGVLGGTHLGQVTAACLASVGHEVTTYGRPETVVEPGLEELQKAGVESGRLLSAARDWTGTDTWGTAAQIEEAFAAKKCAFLWCCQDTTVDKDDVSFLPAVTEEIKRVAGHMPPDSLVLVSSQVPVGTTRELSKWRPDLRWAYSPENLRRKHAIHDCLHPARVVVGTLNEPNSVETEMHELFKPFSVGSLTTLAGGIPIVWTTLESAECVKHMLNALLGACIALTNEVAELATLKGADPKEIERALRSEPRIGLGLPIRAGEGFTGGTLGRDLKTLETLGKAEGLPMTLVGAILESNARHLGEKR